MATYQHIIKYIQGHTQNTDSFAARRVRAFSELSLISQKGYSQLMFEGVSGYEFQSLADLETTHQTTQELFKYIV
ncbi:MAG: hypothetical protein CMF48_03075 [Legionellales bacterium]|nr:hypothetical protein [Legionellales bacterium]